MEISVCKQLSFFNKQMIKTVKRELRNISTGTMYETYLDPDFKKPTTVNKDNQET